MVKTQVAGGALQIATECGFVMISKSEAKKLLSDITRFIMTGRVEKHVRVETRYAVVRPCLTHDEILTPFNGFVMRSLANGKNDLYHRLFSTKEEAHRLCDLLFPHDFGRLVVEVKCSRHGRMQLLVETQFIPKSV